MRQIIASQPATLILFTIALVASCMLCADNVDARRYYINDPNPVIEPDNGRESDIFYSIPDDMKKGLAPSTLISKLPSGCATKYTRDLTYYDCDGVYLKPYFKGNDLVYMVIEEP